jgi:hypothetical protein
MNDFERKLSGIPFRPPPDAMRETLFGRTNTTAATVEGVRWTWRDWFWPSPQAWATLAALWIVFAAVSMGGKSTPAPAPAAPTTARIGNSETTLLSYHRFTDLNDVLQLANN